MITVSRFALLGPQEAAPPDLLPIRLHPGIGWGFGWHPSTQAMLRAMESYGLSGKAVADVGTGVGTLAIAAHLLGASPVYATEIKSDRAEIAKRNCELNAAPVEVSAVKGLPFDVEVVVANLGSSVDTLDALMHATKGFIVTVDKVDVLMVKSSTEAVGFSTGDVETFSNIGPKPEPIPDNYISHIIVGRKN